MHPREAALLVSFVLLVIVPWLTLRDVWRHPARRWEATRFSRWLTTAYVVLVPLLGPAWYLRRVRPAVRGQA